MSGQENTTAPAAAHTSPETQSASAATPGLLRPQDQLVTIYGGSGFHKSCLAALSQQHFGSDLHFQNLPGSWMSSANALEGTLFLAKNALFVIDDFISPSFPS